MQIIFKEKVSVRLLFVRVRTNLPIHLKYYIVNRSATFAFTYRFTCPAKVIVQVINSDRRLAFGAGSVLLFIHVTQSYGYHCPCACIQ